MLGADTCMSSPTWLEESKRLANWKSTHGHRKSFQHLIHPNNNDHVLSYVIIFILDPLTHSPIDLMSSFYFGCFNLPFPSPTVRHPPAFASAALTSMAQTL
eukprot:759688-Hanusia_phi.AAC.5